MFELYAEKNKLTVLRREAVTSGSVGVAAAKFEFSPDWVGLTTKAVFKAGETVRTVLLDGSRQCTIPWELLTTPALPLLSGVFGTRDETVLPTVWANLGTILEGVPTDGEGARPPTPDAWEQELAGKGDGLDYDGLNLSLMSGDKPLSTVQIAGGGGDGVSDHRLLTGRDAGGQHPISAINGLPEELNRIPGPVEALTNEELEALLK